MPESHITIGDNESNYYAELRIYDYGTTSPLHVCEYLYAPGRGDDILADVTKEIQNLSNSRGRRIIHTYHAMGDASKDLIVRNNCYGYQYVRTEQALGREIDVYEKEYSPK